MPGSTPILGLPYPLQGENINSNDFRLLANAIDDALTENQELVNELLDRPFVSLRAFLSQSVTVATETAIVWEFEDVDSDNMFTFASPNQITINTPGVYMITGSRMDLFSFTTVTATRWAIFRNGVLQWAERVPSAQTNSQNIETSISGLVICNTSDTIQLRLLWNGTGGPAEPLCNFSAHFVCELT